MPGASASAPPAADRRPQTEVYAALAGFPEVFGTAADIYGEKSMR